MKNTPAELSVIAGQLAHYRAPDKPIEMDCKLSYEIFRWDKTHPDGTTDNTSIGTVVISRSDTGEEIDYHIVEKRLGGEREIYDAKVTTSKNGVLGESILKWHLNWHHETHPNNVLQVSGVVVDGQVDMDGTSGTRQCATTGPVMCPWLVPFALSHHRLNGEISASFTSIDELTYCKPGQLIQGPNHIQTNEPLVSFCHTGTGTLPIHYVFDAQGRPLFVTFTMLAWILRDID